MHGITCTSNVLKEVTVNKDFGVETCLDCGGKGRVTLGGRCRTCTTQALVGEIAGDTLTAVNRAFATASDRLLGVLS